MSSTSLLKYLYAGYLSRPAAERCIYRATRRHRVRSIVEIGVGTARRAARLIAIAQSFGTKPVRYTGIDLFEARPADAPGLTLKRVFQLLKPLGATVKLIPGDPFSALARHANSLSGTDLVVIAGVQDSESLERARFYIPRMLHEESVMFIEEPTQQGGVVFRAVSSSEAESWNAAALNSSRRAA